MKRNEDQRNPSTNVLFVSYSRKETQKKMVAGVSVCSSWQPCIPSVCVCVSMTDGESMWERVNLSAKTWTNVSNQRRSLPEFEGPVTGSLFLEERGFQ